MSTIIAENENETLIENRRGRNLDTPTRPEIGEPQRLASPVTANGRTRNELGGLAVGAPQVEILALAPEENGSIVYAPTAAASPDFNPSAVIALKAHIQNNEDFDVRLDRVIVSFPLALGGGGVVVLPEVYASADIADGDVDSVFDTTDPLGRLIPAGQSRWVHIQKRKNGRTLNIIISPTVPGGISVSCRFTGFNQDISALRTLEAYVNRNGTTQGSYIYPFAANDLRPAEFWSGSTSGVKSHHARDSRFAHDTGSKGFSDLTDEWDSLMPGTTGAENLDYRVFARPIRAMADGVIEGITDDRKDNDPRCKGGNEGNNGIRIRHGDETAWYLHLMRKSVDPGLAEGDSVKAGQFLALCGNSGSSDAPHLHIAARGDDDHLRPILFRDGWVAQRDELDTENFTGPWVRLDNNALPIGTANGNDVNAVLWPSREVPRRVTRPGDSGNQGSTVDFFDSVALGPTRIVTAEQGTESNRLRLSSWGKSGSEIELLGDSGNLAGSVQAVALVSLSVGQLVTAVKTNESNQKVIKWSTSNDGTTIERLGDSGFLSPEIQLVAAAHLGFGIVATATTSSDGVLGVQTWNCSADEIDLVGDSGEQPGSADLLAMDVLGPGRVVTATRSANSQKLQLRIFGISPDGSSVTPIGPVVTTDFLIDSVDVVATGPDQLIAAVKIQQCSRMKLVAFEVVDDALVMTGTSGVRGDKASASVISLASLGQGMVTTAVHDTVTDRGRYAVWCVEDGGRSVTLLGHSGNLVGNITAVDVVATGSDSAVMIVRTTSGRLKLIGMQDDK